MKETLNRVEAWRKLFIQKGWLQDNRIRIPGGYRVYLYFPPATTDINSIQSICLEQEFEISDEFIIYKFSPYEEEYYLWEDIQCIRIASQRKPLRGNPGREQKPV
jgi:hypothetical protein